MSGGDEVLDGHQAVPAGGAGVCTGRADLRLLQNQSPKQLRCLKVPAAVLHIPPIHSWAATIS